MKKSLRQPALTIAKNAGVDAHVVVEKVLNSTGDVGYDALNGEYVNLVEQGIIDPTKVCILFSKDMLVLVAYTIFCPFSLSILKFFKAQGNF